MTELQKRFLVQVEELMNSELAHDTGHAIRVSNFARKIAIKENFLKPDLAELAGLFHDIGLSQTKIRKEHGLIGALKTKQILEKSDLNLNLDEIQEIVFAITWHDSSRKAPEISTLLQIIIEADTLELLGQVGLARCLNSCGHLPLYDSNFPRGKRWGFTKEDYDVLFDTNQAKAETIVDALNFQISCFGNLKTESSIAIGTPRVEVLKNFIVNLEKELLNSEDLV